MIHRFNLPDWILVFLLFASFYLLLFGRAQEYSYADGSLMFNVTKSIVEDGSFKSRVPGYYRGEVYLESSKYGLGFSIITVPFYLVTKVLAKWIDPQAIEIITRFAPMLANVFITAATCAILFSFATILFRKRYVALIVTMLYGFATIAWPYSRYDFSEPLTGLCLLLSIYSIVLFQQSNKTIWLSLSSISISFAMFTRAVEAVIIFICVLYLFWYFRKEKILINLKVLVGILTPIFITILLFFWYNYYRYGNIFITGYEVDFYNSRIFINTFLVNIYGLLFSPGKGLFWYSPPVLLSVFAYILFWKQHRWLCLFCLVIIILHFLIYSSWVAWEGGWCWGPRNLVPIIPILILPIGYLLQKYRWSIYPAVALLLYGITIQFLGISFPFNIYIQSMIEKGIAYQDLIFNQSYNPINANLLFVIGIPMERMDFALIPLLAGTYNLLTIVVTSILLLIFGISSTMLIKRALIFDKS
jgi:4-amino-4-deoxy-L-arabinose transferase-like glycosyltransferase